MKFAGCKLVRNNSLELGFTCMASQVMSEHLISWEGMPLDNYIKSETGLWKGLGTFENNLGSAWHNRAYAILGNVFSL